MMSFTRYSIIVLATITAVLSATTAMAHGDDDPLLLMLLADQLESRDDGDATTLTWDVQGWMGKDLNKLWLKSEGERESGTTANAELQLLYSKALYTYWDIQAGVRHDFKPSPNRSWAAIAIKGLAPYFFEIDASLFIGESGRTSFRLEAEYELLLTQRVILSPNIEVIVFGKDDFAAGIGSGVSDIEAGLRLRYEIRREFAPYIGINWSRRFGKTADFEQAAGGDTNDTEIVIGIRAWY